MKTRSLCLWLAGVIVGSVITGWAMAAPEKKPTPKWEGSIRIDGEKSKPELAALAKVSIAEVEKAALAAVPGTGTKKVVEIELESEHGFLVYEVEIAILGEKDMWEVIVDAGTGKVLAFEKEKEEKEEKEKTPPPAAPKP